MEEGISVYHSRRFRGILALLVLAGLGTATTACAGPTKPKQAIAVSTGSQQPPCKGLTITIAKVTAYDGDAYDWTLTTDGGARLHGSTDKQTKRVSGVVDNSSTTSIVDVFPNRKSKVHKTSVTVSWPKGKGTDQVSLSLSNPDACPK